MLKEFRDFLLRGNIIELAVAFIAGAAFTAVVNSLVDDVIMQAIAAIVGQPDFSNLSTDVNNSEIRWGDFLTVLVNFVLVMGAVFFFLVKPIHAITARMTPPPGEEEPKMRECPECISEVPVRARRCSHCTSQLAPLA